MRGGEDPSREASEPPLSRVARSSATRRRSRSTARRRKTAGKGASLAAPRAASGRLLAPVALDLDRDLAGGETRRQRCGDLEHPVLVARRDLLRIEPGGYGQAPLEAAVADLAEAVAILLPLPLGPAHAGDGEGLSV